MSVIGRARNAPLRNYNGGLRLCLKCFLVFVMSTSVSFFLLACLLGTTSLSSAIRLVSASDAQQGLEHHLEHRASSDNFRSSLNGNGIGHFPGRSSNAGQQQDSGIPVDPARQTVTLAMTSGTFALPVWCLIASFQGDNLDRQTFECICRLLKGVLKSY